jgi:hypothetical protein
MAGSCEDVSPVKNLLMGRNYGIGAVKSIDASRLALALHGI